MIDSFLTESCSNASLEPRKSNAERFENTLASSSTNQSQHSYLQDGLLQQQRAELGRLGNCDRSEEVAAESALSTDYQQELSNWKSKVLG
mmetsp:Transcript_28957/g.29303  ORF Transcript_28957/g.29303 Transcript_28957/m.29303 type:complete len:90 (+) Transcript_28957:117-386(+)